MQAVSILDQIEEVLGQIRPALQFDGGDIELVDFDEQSGLVRVRLMGACAGCPMSHVTLRMGVEAALRDAIPSVSTVQAV